MKASDIGISRVIQAAPTLGLHAAASEMRRQQVGCLVIVREEAAGAIPVGIVTDRDLVMRALAAGHHLDDSPVGSIMSTPLAVCRDDAHLAEVIAIMRGSGVRRLPLVDATGALVGIVSADDVLVACTELLGQLSQALMTEPLLDRSYA